MRQKKDINIEMGARIQIAREKAGLTQERFAELIDSGAKNISAVERGAAGVSVPTMKKICEVLSVSSDTLLFGSPNKNDINNLVSRLERLSPEQFDIASDVFNKLLEAFALGKK